ncbi:MAG: hypothetical protein KDC83_14930 [Flavobacteriales bacterium]|nr:hypothetical protein [Flavobacteriales bacterium]
MASYNREREGTTNDDFELDGHSIYGSSRLGENQMNIQLFSKVSGSVIPLDTLSLDSMAYMAGYKNYELTNHLGNVLSTVNERKLPLDNDADTYIDAYAADITSQTDYYPYGMKKMGRLLNPTDYKFGFNGKEIDDEVKGARNTINFEYRVYDPRLGRFFSTDLLTFNYPFWSPYEFAGNDPIRFVDILGLGPGDRIAFARKLLGTKYEQQTDKDLRTKISVAAMAYMDCSELICRILADDEFTSEVEVKSTYELIKYLPKIGWSEIKGEPRSGDIIVWPGHTALIESYNKNAKKQYNVLHATRYPKEPPYTKNEVTAESYDQGYYDGKKAKIYRPDNDKPDRGQANGEGMFLPKWTPYDYQNGPVPIGPMAMFNSGQVIGANNGPSGGGGNSPRVTIEKMEPIRPHEVQVE